MLRFFRSIRMRLLSQNRISRYLICALGEIVLVVIGIMPALEDILGRTERLLGEINQQLSKSGSR